MIRWRTAAGSRPVFISYRRDDTSGYAGRLEDDLTDLFGEKHVFRDVIKIEPGRDFHEVIDQALASCSVMVVVIGREWLAAADDAGERRLDRPDDVLRLEVMAALARDTLVIPVLVEKAEMPTVEQLPEPLQGLARRQAVELSDTNWDHDMARLAAAIESAPGGPRRRRRPGHRVWPPAPAVAVALVGVILLALVVQRIRGSGDEVGTPMSGSFNMAVADFESLDAEGNVSASAISRQLSEQFRRMLEREVAAIDGGDDVQQRAVEPLEGRTAEQRAFSAERLAAKIGADVVMYGVLVSDSSASVLTPEFYVTDRLLFDATELVGYHQLGSPVSVDGDVRQQAVRRNELLELLGARTRVFAESVVALGYLSADKFATAADHLKVAEQLPGWAPEEGKELLFLLLGNALGKQAQGAGAAPLYAEAEAYYDRALGLSPNYSRATLGKAEVVYHRARGSCEPGEVDEGGLRRSLETYGRARTGQLPAGGEVAVKAAFGEGRVYLCMSQALTGEFWKQAEDRFGEVIRAYGGRNERLRELAAEAHAGLGLVYRPAGPDEAGAREKYLRAAGEYERAIELYQEVGRRRDRRAFFYTQLDYLYTRVPDLARSDRAHAEAIRLAPDQETAQRYREAHEQDRAVKKPS